MPSDVKSPSRLRRREPVQARSRETVERILDAAAALIDDGGVDAVTTRAIVDRAGLTAPSLYRFFADREQILDALVERHLDRLSTFIGEVEKDWTPASVEAFVEHELGAFADYYRRHPNAARLWLDGRVSATVRAQVLQYHHATARRLQAIAVAAGLVASDTEVFVFLMAVELADRVLEVAFRDRQIPDPDVVEQGRVAISSYLAAALGHEIKTERAR